MHPIRDYVEHESSWKQRTGHPHICTAWAELDENGLHPVVRMHVNLTVMATIARKYETLCELI